MREVPSDPDGKIESQREHRITPIPSGVGAAQFNLPEHRDSTRPRLHLPRPGP